jgi:hypothetical protein
MKAEKLCDCQRQRYAKYRKEFTPFSRKDDTENYIIFHGT